MLKLYMTNLVAAKFVPYTYINLLTSTRDDYEMITKEVGLFGLFL